MQPRLYLRPGVRIQNLTPDTLAGFGAAQAIFYKYNQPFAVTCTNPGNSSNLWETASDQVFGVEKPDSAATLIFQECLLQLGEDWKIANKKTYWRFEFCPKPLEGKPL